MSQKSISRQARFTLVESCDECFGPGDEMGTLSFGAGKDVVKRDLNGSCVGKETSSFYRLTPVLPEVKAWGGGALDETFFPPFLRPASTAHSLWATISCDLCQTVILHSPHTGIPLSSSGLGPFIDILNCA